MIIFYARHSPKLIDQHVVVGAEQGTTSSLSHQIIQDGMRYGVAIKGRCAAAKLVHDR